MREVTPQMLQNEKDAARYRYMKTATHGTLFWDDGWLDGASTDTWDQMIDFALEE